MIYPNPRVTTSAHVHVPKLGVGTEKKKLITLLIKVIALKIKQEKGSKSHANTNPREKD